MGLPINSLPDDKLPQCWSDDVRMNALFAPFRLKTSNPESWDMKMKFWSDMLRQWCKHRKDPTLSAVDAKLAFQRKGRTPACIDIVVEEMLRNGEICPLAKYQQILHNGPEGWVKWGARLAFKPAALAFTAISFMMPSRQAVDNDGLPKASIDSTQRFVLESAVKEQALDLLQNFPPGVEKVGTIDELMRTSEFSSSRETFELLLGYLVSEGSAVKKDDVVKLSETSSKVSPITESDEALVRLLVSERKLENDATRLSRDVQAIESEARAALQLGNRLAAKNHLRRKHRVQQRLDRCEGALTNVRQLLQQVRETEVNAAIVDTYRATSQAMKKGMKEGGLDEDSVHDTMDDLKEVMESYNEVEKALAGSVDDFDNAELEEELKELLSGPGGPSGGTPSKREQTVSVPNIPSPPRERPSRRKEAEREFIFDGEERMLAELNSLSVEDANPRQSEKPKAKEKQKVAEGWGPESDLPKPKPSKKWYPPSSRCLQETGWANNNLDTSLQQLSDSFGEVRQDDRLHPGQPLDVDFSRSPTLFHTDFQVRDHKSSTGVWLFNSTDDNRNDLCGTEYSSSVSPVKSSGGFQMAPGGERRPSKTNWLGEDDEPMPEQSNVDDLERRLRNLRGFNL